MKRGRKPATTAAKRVNGEPGKLPTPPDTLTRVGRKVWAEDAPRAFANRTATDDDLSMLVLYCNLVGRINTCLKKDQRLQGVWLSEVRKLAETFGLCGMRSRENEVADRQKADHQARVIRTLTPDMRPPACC